jgi:hypothetical protein
MIARMGRMLASERHAAPKPPATGLLAWYLGDDLAGAIGSAVSSWPDRSGNANHATQPDAGYQATVNLDVAGFRGLDCGDYSFTGRKDVILPSSLVLNRASMSCFLASSTYLNLKGYLGFGNLGDFNLQVWDDVSRQYNGIFTVYSSNPNPTTTVRDRGRGW